MLRSLLSLLLVSAASAGAADRLADLDHTTGYIPDYGHVEVRSIGDSRIEVIDDRFTCVFDEDAEEPFTCTSSVAQVYQVVPVMIDSSESRSEHELLPTLRLVSEYDPAQGRFVRRLLISREVNGELVWTRHLLFSKK